MSSKTWVNRQTTFPNDSVPWQGDPRGVGGSQFFETPHGVQNTPVIFVHGNRSHPLSWYGHFEYFLEHGYTGDEIWAIEFSQSELTHDELADQLERFVVAVQSYTGVNEVSIVSHSLGVTVSRHWLEVFDRYDSVEKFVGIAGANHGMSSCPPRQLSKLLPASNPCRPCAYFSDNSFRTTPIEELNKDDETPGDIEYYTIRGSRDTFFRKNTDSPRLEGAVENLELDTDHMGAQQDIESIKQTHDWLRD